MALAPDNDNAREPWATLAEKDAPIEGGSFDLAIADATGRFNVNTVISGDTRAVMLLARNTEAAGVPRETTARAVGLLRLFGPVSDLTPLSRAGLDAATLARLQPMLTALPYETKVNVNAADEGLLAIMLADPAGARRLIGIREQRGFLTAADFAGNGLSLPNGAAVTSDLYWVRTRARIGDTAQQLTSLLRRRRAPDGSISVVAIGRWLGARPPAQAPALVF